MGMMEFEAKITKIWDYIDNDRHTRVIRLNIPKSLGFNFSTGQAAFLGHKNVTLVNDSTKLKWGVFSIASTHLDLEEEFMDFCVTANTPNGIAYYISKNLGVGDSVIVKGAFGHYSLVEKKNHYFFAATGSGIAPYIAMLRYLIKTKSSAKLTLFFGCRNPNTYLYNEELEKYSQENKLELIVTFSRVEENFNGKRGYVQERIKEYDFDPSEKKVFYACGMPNFLDAVKEEVVKKGFVEDEILIEKW